MKIYSEIDLPNFEFWSGAKDRAKVLTDDQLMQIQALLEEEDYEDKGYDETYINDLFWFEEDWIAEMLGFSSFEELERANSGEDIDEDYE